MTTEEKLQHFYNSSIEKARLEGQQMLEDYTAALEKIFEEHKESVYRQNELQIKAETDTLLREKNRALSQEQLRIKRMLSKKHSDLKEKLFVEIKDILEEYMDTPEYDKLLIGQIKESLKYANGEPIVIYIDPADSSKMSSLVSATNVQLQISKDTFMGGTRAVIASRNILIDSSFSTRLEEEKANFTFSGGHIDE